MSCLGDMGSATEPAGALSNVGQEARPPPRESFTRREPVLTPHLLFLCEVEAESPAPTLTAPACVVSGASCRLAPKVAGPVWGAGAQNGSSPREADSEAKEKGTRCWNQRDGGSSPSPAVYLCGFRLIT